METLFLSPLDSGRGRPILVHLPATYSFRLLKSRKRHAMRPKPIQSSCGSFGGTTANPRLVRTVRLLLFLMTALLPVTAVARPPLFVLSPIPDQTFQADTVFRYQVAYTVEDPTCWSGDITFELSEA